MLQVHSQEKDLDSEKMKHYLLEINAKKLGWKPRYIQFFFSMWARYGTAIRRVVSHLEFEIFATVTRVSKRFFSKQHISLPTIVLNMTQAYFFSGKKVGYDFFVACQ